MTEIVRDEFAAFGIKVPDIVQEEDVDPVAECNWESLMAFLACDTQWRASGVGFAGLVWIGLDYSGCDIAFRRYGFADDLWDDLRFIEETVLPILNSGDD
jgi:hypothetical protein